MEIVQPEGAGHVTVSTGDVIEILLEDMPGAGFLWAVEVDGPLAVIEPDFDSDRTGPDAPIGGSTTRTWTISTTGAGAGSVRGRRGQAWDDTQSDRSFTLQVDVAAR